MMTLKKLQLVLVVLAAMLPMAAMSANGDTFKVNSAEGKEMLFTVISEDEKTCKITGITDKFYATGSLTIPAEANGYTVTTIGKAAFYNALQIEAISLPNSLTSIESEAFSNCLKLTEMVIPESVTSFGWSVFSSCGSLKSVNILPTWTRIPEDSFRGCTSLESIDIPASITSIGESAFGDCTSLKSLFLPASVVTMESDVFRGCTGLETIVVEEGNPSFDSRDNCNAIIVTAQSNLKYTSKNTTIPPTVRIIGSSAFYRHQELTSFVIPSNIQILDHDAFRECKNLTTVEIPSTVTQIYKNAFRDCTSLTTVKSYRLTPPAVATKVFDNIPADATLYVRPGCKDVYSQASDWDTFKNIFWLYQPYDSILFRQYHPALRGNIQRV